MSDRMMLGEFIYQLRREKGLSQAELGDMVGVSNKAVSKWETCEANPDVSILKLLANSLGVTTDELLEGRRFNNDNSYKNDYKAYDEYKNYNDRYNDNTFYNTDDGQYDRRNGKNYNGRMNDSSNNYNNFDDEYDENGYKKTNVFLFGGKYINNKEKFEYISDNKTKKGLPFVHVVFGKKLDNIFSYKAKGIIAIGMRSMGILSIGLMSLGVISIGVLAIGLLAIAPLALGLLVALGGVSVGIGVSIGAVAVGFVAIGAVAIGYLSIGAVGIGYYVYTGENGYAIGKHIVIFKTYVDFLLTKYTYMRI